MTDPDDNPSNRRDVTSRLCSELRKLAVDPPDRGFSGALRQRLLAEPVPPPVGVYRRLSGWLSDRRPWLWPVSGALCGVATYGLLVALQGAPLRERVADLALPRRALVTGAVLPSFSVPSSKVAIIKLAFTAEVAVENASFEVTLPEGLHFWSGGQRLAERSFRWPGRLEAGENLVPVAVRADRPGRYPVVATVEVDGLVLEQRVVMDVHKERS